MRRSGVSSWGVSCSHSGNEKTLPVRLPDTAPGTSGKNQGFAPLPLCHPSDLIAGEGRAGLVGEWDLRRRAGPARPLGRLRQGTAWALRWPISESQKLGLGRVTSGKLQDPACQSGRSPSFLASWRGPRPPAVLEDGGGVRWHPAGLAWGLGGFRSGGSRPMRSCFLAVFLLLIIGLFGLRKFKLSAREWAALHSPGEAWSVCALCAS